MLLKRVSPQDKRHTQIESKGMEKDISCKHKWQTNKGSNTQTKQTLKHKSQRKKKKGFRFSSVAQLCPTLCDPMNRSTPGLPVHHQKNDIT